MATVIVTPEESTKLHRMLKIEYFAAYARSTAGKMELLEDMHDNATEEAAQAIAKAMGK